MRRRYSWPDGALQILKTRMLQGWSASKIAREVNMWAGAVVVTRNAVIGKADRLKIPCLGAAGACVRDHPGRKNFSASQYRASRPRKPKPQAPKPLAPYRPKPAGEPGAEATPFLRRTALQCAWIFDDVAQADSLCCGKPIASGACFSFCSDHMAMAQARKYRKDAA